MVPVYDDQRIIKVIAMTMRCCRNIVLIWTSGTCGPSGLAWNPLIWLLGDPRHPAHTRTTWIYNLVYQVLYQPICQAIYRFGLGRGNVSLQHWLDCKDQGS